VIKLLCASKERYLRLKEAAKLFRPKDKRQRIRPRKITTTGIVNAPKIEFKPGFKAVNNMPLVANDKYWQWRRAAQWEKTLKKYEE